MYCLFCVVLCIVCVYMCTVLLPPGGYPIAVKYIISYHILPEDGRLRQKHREINTGEDAPFSLCLLTGYFSKELRSTGFVISHLHTIILSFLLVTKTYVYTYKHIHSNSDIAPSSFSICESPWSEITYYAVFWSTATLDMLPKIAVNNKWHFIEVVPFPVRVMKAYSERKTYGSTHSSTWH